MNFLQKIKNSIYSPEFYSQVPKETLGSAFKYYFLLILVLTVLQAILPIWLFATVLQKQIDAFPAKVESSYPSKLEVKVKNGKVSTNAHEPYFIAIPGSANQSDQVKNFIVIDTKTPFSESKFDQYNTFAWVTKDSVFTKNNNQLKATDLSGMSDMTINKSFVDSTFVKITPWLKYASLGAGIFILIGLYIFYSIRLIYFFLLALIVMLLLKILKKPVSYWDSYKVVLYAGTLGFIIEIIAGVTHWYGFPFMFTMVTLLAVLFNFLPATPVKIATKAKKK